MKRLMFTMMFLMFVCVVVVSAGEPIGVFANNNTNSIQLINPLTMETTGPLLGGELGSYGGGLFDVVITSNGKTAIVSNFGDSRIFFIDISGGFNAVPVVLGSVRIPFFAEDMDITPDDKYVLVTDGGFSPRVGVVNIAGRYLLQNNYLGSRSAQAVAITPNGQTVVVADYFGRSAHAYTLQADGTLVHTSTVRFSPFTPVNVTISPDGQTAILPIAGYPVCVALTINSQGKIYLGEIVAMPAKNGQSCVFNNTGDKAYYISNSQAKGFMVVELNVSGPGQVSASGTTISLPRRGTSQLFGVDTIALDPSGNYLYVSNPTVSGGLSGIAVVDLAAQTKVHVVQGTGIPTGITFATIEED